jgi:hypothetical protein
MLIMSRKVILANDEIAELLIKQCKKEEGSPLSTTFGVDIYASRNIQGAWGIDMERFDSVFQWKPQQFKPEEPFDTGYRFRPTMGAFGSLNLGSVVSTAVDTIPIKIPPSKYIFQIKPLSAFKIATIILRRLYYHFIVGVDTKLILLNNVDEARRTVAELQNKY